MKIAVVTFDGFNEIDSLVASHILNRIEEPGWKAEITAPTETVTSMNGVTITAQQPLEFLTEADAVIFGSGRLTRQVIEDRSIMERLTVNPHRQLIASQCSGALIMARLGLLDGLPVCTDVKTRRDIVAQGFKVLNAPFHAQGNIASAGGCLASQYLASWIIWRKLGKEAAIKSLTYFAPVGQHQEYISLAVEAIANYIHSDETRQANSA